MSPSIIYSENGIASTNSRRNFLAKSLKLTVVSGIAGISLVTGCNNSDKEDKEVSPPEDLMQEHGLLNRVLLIYDTCRGHLANKEDFPVEAIARGADVIKRFVEDYHERQEEDYLFTRFRKANQLVDLVEILQKQHNAGRAITGRILELTKNTRLSDSDKEKMIKLLSDFNVMYRPHEAREDTILFPAFRKIVSKHEYDSLGEEFEKNEHRKFGEDGFENMVNKVADIEKVLGIYDLNKFTPAV